MKEMLYYPGFEVQNKTWLKFALLYFDCLRPIIPYTIVHEKEYLSDTFQRVMSETDLITPYRPQYEEGVCASTLACDEFEKYLNHPERYGVYFGRPYANRLLEKWQNPMYQDCTLFEGKYSNAFFEFCIENNIATPCREGVRISNDLAFVYMSLLADIISRNNELEMITDSTRYSSILLKNDMIIAHSTQNNLKIAKNNIEFSLPGNLRNIPIEDIIQLRGQQNFNELRKAYIKEIGKLIDSQEGENANYSLDNILSYKKDIIKLCEKSFNMIAAATVSVFSFKALNDGIQGAGLISAMASAYMDYSTAKDAIIEIPQFVEQLKTKRLARKYVAKVGKLNTEYRYRG